MRRVCRLLLDKSDVKVGVRHNCAYVDFAREAFPRADLVLFDDYESMVRGVAEQRD